MNLAAVKASFLTHKARRALERASTKAMRTSAWVVLVTDGKMLLLQRSKTARNPGLWNFPGGNVDPGESPTKSAARELLEETGIKVSTTNMRKLKSIVSGQRTMHFYLVKKNKVPTVRINTESSKYKWCSLKKFPRNLHMPTKLLRNRLLQAMSDTKEDKNTAKVAKGALSKTSKFYDTAYLNKKGWESYYALLSKLAKKFGMVLDRIEKVEGGHNAAPGSTHTYRVYYYSPGIKKAREFKSAISTEVWPKVKQPRVSFR